MLDEAVLHYLEQLREGDVENAFFCLFELGLEPLPILIAAASEPRNRDIRACLVVVVCQYRRPEAIDFLGTMLDDADPAKSKAVLVWSGVAVAR